MMVGLLIIAAAAQPTATARADVTEVTLGDTFQVTVDVVHDAELVMSLSSALALGAAFSEEKRAVSSRSNDDGTVTSTWELSIGAYDVGEQELPAIPVTFAVEGVVSSVETEPIAIQVASFIGDAEAELRPIAGPVEVMSPDWTVIWVLGGIAAAVVLFFAGWILRYLLRRRTVALVAQMAPAIPADEEALARLVELEASGALDAEDLEPAYTSLSEIVRGYLGRRFEFPAIDLTSEEINRDLEQRAETRELAGELRQWFDTCDVVKFAEYPSSPDEARAALYQARQLVQKSVPKPPEAAVDG